MSNFTTLAEVLTLSGRTYTADEQIRIETVIPLVCDALRYEAQKVGKDLDMMMLNDDAYASVVKLVTVDVVVRVMRQSTEGEPMSQETQSALGYSWSGTYVIPGGGISGAILRNDLKRLGFKQQQIGSITLWPTESQAPQ